jgi:hypothetical protein
MMRLSGAYWKPRWVGRLRHAAVGRGEAARLI